jgi:prepilin-type N-terminal cleavage/methylation domain-containing protein
MRSQRGFSLPEVLFALLILTIVFTTTLAMFTERNRRLQQASEVILAYQALANESEVIRRVGYTELDFLSDDFATDTTVLRPLAPFQTTVDVTVLRPGVKNVTLAIKWRADKEAKLSLVRVDTGGSNLW